ncbi:MAG: hypothetical protein GY869_07615 [Planctomycetes bacterium]|nr:hypothetical protein [Planctomycetota bacterium]
MSHKVKVKVRKGCSVTYDGTTYTGKYPEVEDTFTCTTDEARQMASMVDIIEIEEK